ncbi:DMT family transporter [Schlegelella sp. S2-27]|uniref:DMT family transporter n=1 Tax=Caldimonas mangrovi TaxID=2944811 RepID=A0ABT0YU43_9BURK|nr:DMT family transporter [Caldimonas mangrovi]MCM5681814.1 DMT family transporter [Caldimonas mangrovi]
MTESSQGQWLCSAAMVLVGSTVVASKVIGQDVEPFLATALRHAAALPVFLLLMVGTGARFERVGWRDAALLTLQAAAGSVGYTVLLIQGVTWSSAADAGIVAGTLPAVSALFAAVFLGERPGLRLAFAIALATAGVMAVAAAPAGPAHAPTRLLGIVMVLAAIGCEAVFILANKRLSRPLPPLALSTLMCAGGLVLSALPAALAMRSSPSVLSVPALAGIVYYAWVPTVGGFLLWYAGSARTSGARASLATAWLPVSALLLSAAVLAEPVRLWQWVGLGCVLAAVWLASRDGTPAPAAALNETAAR